MVNVMWRITLCTLHCVFYSVNYIIYRYFPSVKCLVWWYTDGFNHLSFKLEKLYEQTMFIYG